MKHFGIHRFALTKLVLQKVRPFHEKKAYKFDVNFTFFFLKYFSFPKEEYYRQNDFCMLPTFIDMTGFENDDSVITEELLFLVLSGKVKEKESLNDIATHGRLHGITTMKNEYRTRSLNRRINRIIIVCSLNPDSAMPTALFKSVVNVANELGNTEIT